MGLVTSLGAAISIGKVLLPISFLNHTSRNLLLVLFIKIREQRIFPKMCPFVAGEIVR
jgi:hypothetical protein